MHNSKGGGDEEKTEPKENDKWMENNDHEKDSEMAPKSSRLDELRGRAKQFASNKHHVIVLLLCIFLFILFLIVIILAVQLGTYKCPVSNECRTPECLRTASAVVARSEPSFDPCDDFWSFSCHGWVTKTPLPKNKGTYSITDQLKEKVYSRIRHLIDLVPYDSDPTSAQFKVKTFYASCRDLKEIEVWVPEKIKQTIHDIGGWALIKDSPGGHWKRNDVLKKLQVVYGVSAFFKVLVEADDTDPTRNIIKLVPAGLGLPSPRYYETYDEPYVKAYQLFIKNIVHAMDVELYKATKFAEQVFSYEKRIAEITPRPDTLRNTKDLYSILTVQELDRLSSSISWTDILQSYFPDVVTADTKIAVLSEKYFKDISEIISSTDSSVLNNYYMWRFMHTFAPHSSTKFRLVVNSFKQDFEGITDTYSSFEDNWEYCIDVTSQYLGHAVGALYVQRYFPSSVHDKIHVYLHKLIGALNSVGGSLPWLSGDNAHESAESKIRSLAVLSGHPGFARNRSLDSYYQELQVQADYFQNIKNGVYFLHIKQQDMLRNKAITDYSWTIYPHDVSVDYKYVGNQLVVPAGLFDEPLFDVESPLAVKYGILAAHVANKLAGAFDDKGINYNMYGVLEPWIGNNSLHSFKMKEGCVKKSVSNYSLQGVPVDSDLTIGSLIADIGGVKIAYEAYKRHAQEESSERVLPGMNVNNNQLFFMSYAQSLCQIINPKKLMSSKDSSTHLPEELRVLATLQQMPEFANAFSCSGGSVMNSQKFCRMW
ncbi:endothelin-converting enzyme 2 [Parasteatoda tepidariorum]|uniref:endothelin-converting enzyme 2 n=1 Tax=Parasteatoda tepidariorum TaxID=114398 RepID=UPI001C729777|nr:endothelin-converting enzyme 2 [Parasteatoda tepidariorum]